MVLTLILGKVYGYRHRERQRERVRRRRRRRRRRSRLGCGEKRRGPTMLVTSPHARLWLHVAMVMLICGLGVVAWFLMGEGATWAYVIGWQLSEVGLSWLTPTTRHDTHTHTHTYTHYTHSHSHSQSHTLDDKLSFNWVLNRVDIITQFVHICTVRSDRGGWFVMMVEPLIMGFGTHVRCCYWWDTGVFVDPIWGMCSKSGHPLKFKNLPPLFLGTFVQPESFNFCRVPIIEFAVCVQTFMHFNRCHIPVQ